ncbi:MAG: CDP-alcohol phosphatidyltransferase family protein [Acidobacteriota bacterium]|nr:CDP-alcohol phosphatidyltransferase family protein [Acidobacteriota bacterium]
MADPRGWRMVPRLLDRGAAHTAEALAGVFIKLGLTPNAVTLLGLAVSWIAAYFLWRGEPVPAFLLGAACGGLDMLDGKIAVRTGRRTRFGALLDSSLDRYSEFAFYLALAVRFQDRWPLWAAFAAFLGSTMVSYVRARAEGLGFECRRGLMQRADRFLVLGLALLAAIVFPVFDQAMAAALVLIAVVSNITAVQRILIIRRLDQSKTPRK